MEHGHDREAPQSRQDSTAAHAAGENGAHGPARAEQLDGTGEHDARGADDHGQHGGHGGHGDHAGRFRRLFWIMLLLALPVVAASSAFADLLGYPLPATGWVRWISPVLGTVMFAWGGQPFLTGAAAEIRARRPGMMLLIVLAITVAFLSSWAATLGLVHRGLEFWWELALLIVIMLLGHWVEMRSLARTSSALESIAALLPDTAERVEDGRVVTVSPDDVRIDDRLVVRPGGRVPADGRIAEGAANMDESLITGESRPVMRGAGDTVVAGTVATDSGVRVDVTAVGEDTALAGIQRLVQQAQHSRSRAQRLADTAAGWLFWFALGAAALAAVAWSLLGSTDTAVTRTITVLVIACPHALGLAIPLVVSLTTERAARGGVLIKDRLALESMRTVDVVLFDKTGTLTRGAPTVREVEAAGEFDRDAVLATAAAAESDSEHPLARAVVEAATARGLRLPQATDFTAEPAVGVRAAVEHRQVAVGGPELLRQHGQEELDAAARWRGEGASILHVLVDGAVVGALELTDEVRPESRSAVDALHRVGIDVAMITGDAQQVARSVAGELGIDRFFSEVRPEHKSAAVRQLQEEGRAVAMVGDGINDAPALAQADVGIAIGAGTDVAIASAGVILASDDPRSVLSVVELSRAGYRKMLQNLWWAAGYNLLAVPLAAGVLAFTGFVLPMSVGAILMSLSTLVVAANAQLLRGLDLRPESSTRAILNEPGPAGEPAHSR